MRSRAIVGTLLVVALAAIIAVPTASAQKKIPTQIEVLGEQSSRPFDWFVYGLLHSKNEKCIRNRSVLLAEDIDKSLSSRNGAWAVYVAGVDGTKETIISVERKKLRNGDVCKATSVFYHSGG